MLFNLWALAEWPFGEANNQLLGPRLWLINKYNNNNLCNCLRYEIYFVPLEYVDYEVKTMTLIYVILNPQSSQLAFLLKFVKKDRERRTCHENVKLACLGDRKINDFFFQKK